MLTKKYYKKRQIMTMLFCTLFAAIVGSFQTAWITKEIRGKKKTKKKAQEL